MIFVMAASMVITLIPLGGSQPTDRIEKGTPMPKAELVYIQGGEGPLLPETLEGRAVLLNFWATYCGPCKEEMPALQKLQDQYGGDHFTVLGIASESPNKVQAFLTGMGVTYPVVLDRTGRLGKKLKVNSIPFNVFVGPDGRIMGDVTGELDYETGAERVEALVAMAKQFRAQK